MNFDRSRLSQRVALLVFAVCASLAYGGPETRPAVLYGVIAASPSPAARSVFEALFDTSFASTRSIVENYRIQMGDRQQGISVSPLELWRYWVAEVPVYEYYLKSLITERRQREVGSEEFSYFDEGLTDLFDEVFEEGGTQHPDRDLEPFVKFFNEQPLYLNYLQAIVATYNFGIDQNYPELVELSSTALRALVKTSRFGALVRVGGYPQFSASEGGALTAALYRRLFDRYAKYQQSLAGRLSAEDETVNLAAQMNMVAEVIRRIPVSPMIRTGKEDGTKDSVIGVQYLFTW